MPNNLFHVLKHFFSPLLKSSSLQARLLLSIYEVLCRTNNSARQINNRLEFLTVLYGHLHPEEFEAALKDFAKDFEAQKENEMLSKYEDELADLSKPDDEGAHDE